MKPQRLDTTTQTNEIALRYGHTVCTPRTIAPKSAVGCTRGKSWMRELCVAAKPRERVLGFLENDPKVRRSAPPLGGMGALRVRCGISDSYIHDSTILYTTRVHMMYCR